MSALDLDIAPRLIGRAHRPAAVAVVRDLVPADLAMLEVERGIQPTRLTRLRDSHHNLARLLAVGTPGIEAAAITGYTGSRISILKDDPAFQELIAFYREDGTSVTRDAVSAMTQVRNDALEVIHERILDEPAALSNEFLLDTVKTLADRTGHGPMTKSTNLNVNVDLASRVAQGRARAQAQQGVPALAAPVVSGDLPSPSQGAGQADPDKPLDPAPKAPA